MNPEVRIEMVHMQLTRSCNLQCWFCGQRKFNCSKEEGAALSMKWADWEKVIVSLIHYRQISGNNPCIMLWGGEPLLSVNFEKIVTRLYKEGFHLGMVTNGTLLDRNIELCREAFEKIYISVDGPEEIHDNIRGPGVYQKVKETMHGLKGGPKLVNMAVLTPEVRNRLPWLLDAFVPLQPDQVILQEMIGLNEMEVNSYKEWLLDSFGQQAHEINAWEGKIDYEPARQKRECLAQLAGLEYPFEISYLPHGSEAESIYCLSPFRHAHIMWNGNVTFCTDFTDFSAGNVKEQDILEIFESHTANRFREEIQKGNCVTCQHCSWKNSLSFNL